MDPMGYALLSDIKRETRDLTNILADLVEELKEIRKNGITLSWRDLFSSIYSSIFKRKK